MSELTSDRSRNAPAPAIDDRTCPDGGRCHHGCSMTACFRVSTCEPLSGVYDDDVWPERVLRALGGDHRPADPASGNPDA